MTHCSLFKWNSSMTCLILHSKVNVQFSMKKLIYFLLWKRNSTSFFLYGLFLYLFWHYCNFHSVIRQVTWKQYSTYQCCHYLQASLLLRYHFKLPKPFGHAFSKPTLLPQANHLLPSALGTRKLHLPKGPNVSAHQRQSLSSMFNCCFVSSTWTLLSWSVPPELPLKAFIIF